MGTTIADLVVKVGADLDELDSGVDKGVKSVGKGFDKMGADADKASKNIDQAGAKAAKSFDGLDGAAARAGMALKGIGDDADRAAAGVEGAGKKTGDGFVRGVMSGIGDLDNKLGSAIESTFDNLKGPALAGGAAAGATFMTGMNELFSREAGADVVAARLGMDPAQSERIGRISGELFANAYGSSMEEVGSGRLDPPRPRPGLRPRLRPDRRVDAEDARRDAGGAVPGHRGVRRVPEGDGVLR
jgi:hypothetical protein